MGTRPWDSEGHAEAVVKSRLGGVVKRVDPGGGAQQRHDFDVHLGDGRTIAVEVTRHNVETSLKRLDAVAKRNRRPFATLRFNWVVDFVPEYNVGYVLERISAPLEAFEADGIEEVLLRGDDVLEGAHAALQALGARLVYRLGPAEPGGGVVVLGEASSGGATAPEVIVDVVEHHAHLEDNAAKLSRASEAAERHLFVWVETSQHQAVAAMAFGFLPERAPMLPDFIDAAWAVTAFDGARIWRYRRDEWLHLGTFTLPDEN
jgi:hypothetical protein